MSAFLSYITPTLIFPAVTILLLFYFFITYWHHSATASALQKIASYEQRMPKPRAFALPKKIHPLDNRDTLPLLLLTVLYAITAFWNLGSTTNPQSYFYFEEDTTVTLTLEEPEELYAVLYYPALGTGYYTFEVLVDDTWYTLAPNSDESNPATHTWMASTGYGDYSLSQDYTTLFKWTEVTLTNSIEISKVRLSGWADGEVLQLGELVLFGENGTFITPTLATSTQAIALFDDTNSIPYSSSWYNSTYFDEIYHARTALEQLEGVSPYEISHPPLGKIILSLGISLFGMTPFGWRFMGTLVGVLMVPLLYIFLKNLFGKRLVATCGTILLATEFMHLTQTRIATIDSYGVFFILLMYYFLYRWIALPSGHSFKQGIIPLLLSGLSFGLGVACKWTVLYGGIGLALLFFFALMIKVRDWPLLEERKPWKFVVPTLAFCVLSFVAIPVVIYTLSYLPYLWAYGGNSLSQLIDIMWDNQLYMFTYHSGVTASHPYSSVWYEWVLNLRPILYYLDYDLVAGTQTSFGAFLNPVVCWGGLLAMISMVVQVITKKCTVALFILVGYLSQLVPWMFVSRITFAYHYFPSSLFLILALGYVFNHLLTIRGNSANKMIYGMAGGATLLYGLYYPVLVGIAIPSWYGSLVLKWLPNWPF